jgi:hypothetical protein
MRTHGSIFAALFQGEKTWREKHAQPTDTIFVAVKRLKQPSCAKSRGYDNAGMICNSELLQEAEAIAAFSHPNILKLVGVIAPTVAGEKVITTSNDHCHFSESSLEIFLQLYIC